jgi:predicted nucleic acid-binding Zn ribbon protein
MPTYVYKFVDTGETIEVQQGFHDENLTEIVHPDSGEVLPVKKVFTPVGVTFKGSGFFKTDNRGKKSASSPPSTSGDSSSSSSSDSSTKSESKSDSKSETKSESKSESKSATKTGSSGATT